MAKQKRIPEFERLATEMVGDDKTPDVFFVSVQGVCVLITTDFTAAYGYWESISHEPYTKETALENRSGTVASIAPKDDDDNTLVKRDDGHRYKSKRR